VYDPQTLKPAGEFVIGAGRFRTDTPRSMCFSPDGKLLACGTGGDTAYLLNSADWKPVGTIQPNAACIAFSADGRFLLTAGSNGVELRDLKKCLAASGANR
jgi:WD40 repeat protein